MRGLKIDVVEPGSVPHRHHLLIHKPMKAEGIEVAFRNFVQTDPQITSYNYFLRKTAWGFRIQLGVAKLALNYTTLTQLGLSNSCAASMQSQAYLPQDEKLKLFGLFKFQIFSVIGTHTVYSFILLPSSSISVKHGAKLHRSLSFPQSYLFL